MRVRYTCTLQASKILVSSTKMIAGPEHDYLEFVLGMKHTIKGIDRALPYLSVGQRALITVSAEYAYGSKGFQSLIPPHSNLVFDLTLISFRRRPAWRKQLIQTAGLSEKPYEEISGEDAESVDLQAMR